MSTTPPAVDRSEAARRSVEARRVRAAVKAALSSGNANPVRVLREAPESDYSRMRITEFLTSIPGVGPKKAEAILGTVGISERKRIGALGRRQAESLARYLARGVTHAERSENRLFVLAGPTAVGKGTVATYIHNHEPDVMISVSATTRLPRVGEVDGVNYYFVDDRAFDAMIVDGEFLEWATVHNAFRYGTPRKPVEEALAAGRRVLLEIDLQGARMVKAKMPNVYRVFLLPPSWEELVRRLTGRGTESAEEQERRLETAKVEIASVPEFDAVVVNDDVARAAREVVGLMKETPARANPS